MILIFAVLLVALAGYVVYLPFHQQSAVNRAVGAAERGDLEGARHTLEVLERESPLLVESQVHTLRGQLVVRHRERGAERCRLGDYAGGLRDFETSAAGRIAAEPPTDMSTDAAFCRLAHARVLADADRFDDALAQLVRVTAAADAGVGILAWRQAVNILDRETSLWLARGEPARAFLQLDERRRLLGGHVDLVAPLTRLQRQLERRVFGAAGPSSCEDAVERVARQRPRTVLTATELERPVPGDGDRGRLVVRNESEHVLRVMLRGRVSAELKLGAGAKDGLWVEPGQYAVLVFSPGNCGVRPSRAVWTVEPAMGHEVRLVKA